MPGNQAERRFQFTNNALLILLSVTMILPLVHLAAISLSTPEFAEAKLVYLWPRDFNLETYKTIFGISQFWRSMAVSIYITIVGTAVTLLLCSSLAYSLSRPGMKGKQHVMRGIIITLVFSIPLIPSFLVVRELGMIDSLWSLIIPGALSAFNVIIMKTFFQGVSAELLDAAKIDGSTEFRNYYLIVLPLSKAVLATIGLFHAVNQWNAYFGALIYIRTKTLMPLQLLLRQYVMEDQSNNLVYNTPDVLTTSTPAMIKAGAIIFCTLPILLVYPFIQKYFVKGATLGALKE